MKAPRKRRWPRMLAVLACFAVIALLVWQLPVFRLSGIDATDMRSVSQEDLISASGLIDGQHLFAGLGGTLTQIIQLRYSQVESRLAAAFPSIKTIRASMDFPGRISLEIVERVEVAYIKIPDGCVMIDKEGVALAVMPEAPGSIPVIEGVKVTSMTLGQPLSVDVPSALNSAIALMGAIIDADKDDRTDQLLLSQIRGIMPIGGRQLYLSVILPNTGEELSVAAETGSEQVDDMLWLRFALAQGVFDGRGKGVLDLTGSRKTFTPD